MFLKHPLPYAAKHARELRKRSTEAEDIFWKAVRNRRFHGLKFRRQVPIGHFIVDFLCTKPALIIELDGPIHSKQIQQDTERSQGILEDVGIPILRVKNEEVLHHFPAVLKRMEGWLLPHPPPPSPDLSRPAPFAKGC